MRGAGLPLSALDQRVAIVGTSGSGKTYATKGLVEQLLDQQARVCVMDPLGVWWGLRAGADGVAPGYPVVVFGGRHADVPLDEGMGTALGRLVGTQPLACVVDLSEMSGSAARRRFATAFAEALFESNEEPLHLVLDEADLWAPQRPRPDAYALLGRIEEIVRRGRVRGFIPWLITQRPAVINKDVLSQADILIAMKLTSSHDREAVGSYLEGQSERAESRRILADLPKLARGEGYLWAPSDGVLARVAFPAIRTYDSSRTPRRGEQPATPRTLAEVDLSAIMAALSAAGTDGNKQEAGRTLPGAAGFDRRRLMEREQMLAAAQTRIADLEAEVAELRARLEQIMTLARGVPADAPAKSPEGDLREPVPQLEGPPVAPQPAPRTTGTIEQAALASTTNPPRTERLKAGAAVLGATLHPAARKLLAALAQHAPARFTWGQAATLAGLKAAGGHYNAGRKQLRDLGLVEEAGDLVAAGPAGLDAAGEVPSAPSTPGERLALWCERLPSPAPEMLRSLATHGGRYTEAAELAAALGKKPTGGHWNSGLALLRNNGLVEVSGKRLRVSELFR